MHFRWRNEMVFLGVQLGLRYGLALLGNREVV